MLVICCGGGDGTQLCLDHFWKVSPDICLKFGYSNGLYKKEYTSASQYFPSSKRRHRYKPETKRTSSNDEIYLSVPLREESVLVEPVLKKSH